MMLKLFLLLLLLASPVQAATRYISPSGTDSGDCTNSGSPCRTFAYLTAAARTVAGDLLILKDGTYTAATNGNGTRIINLSCPSTNNSGTAAAPIIMRAENERQAFLSSTGGGWAIRTNGCSYWSFEGIRSQSADLNVNPSEGFIGYSNGTGITFKRCLFSNNNRYHNESVISCEGNAPNALLEENEIYSFHRNGVLMCSSGVARRNYINSRSYADIAGGVPSTAIDGTRGDDSIVLYPASNVILENNITENSAGGWSIQSQGTSDNNLFLGNIDIGSASAFHSNHRGVTSNNNIHRNNLSLNATSIGFYIRSSANTTFENNTAIDATLDGFAADEELAVTSSFFSDSSLSWSNGRYGYNITQDSFLLDYANAFENGTAGFQPAASHASITNESTADPQLGSCRAWIPSSSPMKGTAKNGKDFGANILYQYQNGVLTSTPLWNTSTNDFVGCGVVVAGVNDVAGSSCSNVDLRLNIGAANGCAYPAGYGSAPAGGGPWVATDDFESYTVGNDLNGGAGGSGWNGNWTQGTAGVTIAVPPWGGKAAFTNADPDFSYTRAITALTAGIFRFEFQLGSNTPTNGVKFVLDESGTGRMLIAADSDGFVKLVDNASTRFNIGPYSANTRTTVDVQFNDSAQPDLYRARLNSGVWSQWFTVIGSTYTSIDRVRVASDGAGFNTTVFFDSIQAGSEAVVVGTIQNVSVGTATAWHLGEQQTISWSSVDLTGNIDVLVTRNSGATYEPIALGVANTCASGSGGCYVWTVTGPASPGDKSTVGFRIRSSSTPGVYSDSPLIRIRGTYIKIR